MVRKKGTLSIERLESIHFPDEWKNTGNLLVSDLKELANLSVMVNASNPSIHVKKVKMQEPEMTIIMGTRLFPSPRQAAMALSIKAETQ